MNDACLFVAANCNQCGALDWLASHGAALRARQNVLGYTALHLAASAGHEEVCRQLCTLDPALTVVESVDQRARAKRAVNKVRPPRARVSFRVRFRVGFRVGFRVRDSVCVGLGGCC